MSEPQDIRLNPDAPDPQDSDVLAKLIATSIRLGGFFFVGQVAVALVQFFIAIPVYTRIFVPAEYGLLSLIELLVVIGSILLGNTLQSSTTRFLPYYRNIGRSETFYSTISAFSIVILVGFVIVALPTYFIVRNSLSGDFSRLIPIAIGLIVLSTAFATQSGIIRMNLEPKRYVVWCLNPEVEVNHWLRY